jgi:hypothetical protein
MKLGDFGMARTQSEFAMTEYVVARWYRAPELLFHRNNYTTASICLLRNLEFNEW